MNQQKKGAHDIQSMTIEERWRRWLDRVEVDLLYVMIGYLDEYSGVYHCHEHRVEGFSANELEKARAFHQLCTEYVQSMGQKQEVLFHQTETGFSSVHSPWICSKLAEHYLENDDSNREAGSLEKNDPLCGTPGMNDDLGEPLNRHQYSFLWGIFLRNEVVHEGVRKVVFTNSGQKAQWTLDFLRACDCFGTSQGDCLTVSYFFHVPHATHIVVPQDALLWKEIDRWKQRFSG